MDYTDFLYFAVIVVFVLSLLAQWQVNATYKKYAKINAAKGLSAEDVAAKILKYHGVNIPINPVAGNLTDHYDPRKKTLNLSSAVYGSTSIAAYGVAAHEAGHAIQHAKYFSPLMFRNWFFPAASIGSNFGPWLFFAGLLFQFDILLDVGLLFFAFAVVFSIVTLPVELDASRRAIVALDDGKYLTGQELGGAKKVLTAAALTYVAATAMAILQFLRFLAMRDSRRR